MAEIYTDNLRLPKPSASQGTKTPDYNEALSFLDAAVAGKLTRSVAGSSNVTLESDEARNAVMEFTGALTGNITVSLPSGSSKGRARVVVVHNNTSGAFTLTFAYQGGTGLAITQGKARALFHNGTNVYAAGPEFTPSTGAIDAISQADADTRYVNTTGDTMTGDLTVQRASVSASAKALTTTNHAAFFEASANSGVQVARLQAQAAGSDPFVGTLTNHGMGLVTNAVYRLVVQPGGAVKLAVATALPGAYDADSIYLYAEGASAELKVRDEAGNITTLSPHAQDAPAWMYDAEDVQPPQMTREVNIYAGTIRFTNDTRLKRLMALQLEAKPLPLDLQKRKVIHVETFAEYNTRLGLSAGMAGFLVRENWEANQEAIRARREAERSAWASAKARYDAALVEWEKLSAKQKAETPRPAFDLLDEPPVYVVKPRPLWLKP